MTELTVVTIALLSMGVSSSLLGIQGMVFVLFMSFVVGFLLLSRKGSENLRGAVFSEDGDYSNVTGVIAYGNSCGEVRDASFQLKDNAIVFHGGEWMKGAWHNGTWEDGTWHGGLWEDGTWHGGLWEDGTWRNGAWEGGTWQNGTWQNGTWYQGAWGNGLWKDGEWMRGTWQDGIWNDGIWYRGTWRNGMWCGGTWRFGLWDNGTWNCGQWNDGKWKDGTWKDGTWLNGTWEVGLDEAGKTMRVAPKEWGDEYMEKLKESMPEIAQGNSHA